LHPVLCWAYIESEGRGIYLPGMSILSHGIPDSHDFLQVFGHGGSRPSTPSYKKFDRCSQEQAAEQLRSKKSHRQGPVSSSSDLETHGVRAERPASLKSRSGLNSSAGRRDFESQPSGSTRPQAISSHHPYPFAHVQRQLVKMRHMPSHGIPTPASSNSPRRAKSGSRLASVHYPLPL
jgi:hypothetical protein